MTNKNNANIGFEKQIWAAACVLWGHIPAAEYRKVIVGLIFLRYISGAFEKRYAQLVADGDGFEDDRDAYDEENIFFVPVQARWSTISAAAHTPEIGTVIDNAMRAIEKENASLKNVLPKNYASPDLDKRVLGEVVDLFTNNMNMDDTEESKDLLGRTYEYCISQFAAYEGVKGGEFYTPSSIVKTIVAILKPFDNCRIYDPCCGSGGMFVQSVKFLEAHSGNRNRISVFGQESNADTWKMAKMNMAIRGIDADFGSYQADTFFNDLHPTLKADFIMANPPFNLSNWGQDKLQNDVRWKFGLPPANNANYAWIQHMIHHLAPDGKIGLVLANGALSTTTGGEGDIRKNIIENDLVEGIVALPPQLFYSVTIPVSLWFISKNKKQKDKTLFIDARNMGYMTDRRHRDFSEEDIQKLADTFESFQNGTLEDIEGFCASANIKDIAEWNYILTPGIYVEKKEVGFPIHQNTKTYTLSELATIKYGKNQSKVIADDGAVPIYGTGGLMGYSTQALYDKPSILIGRKGTIDKVRYVEHPFWTVDTLFYTEINTDVVIPYYLYSLMQTIDFSKYDEGTTIPSLRTETLNKLKFKIPPIEEQEKVVERLKFFDDKIESNNLANKQLAEKRDALLSSFSSGELDVSDIDL